MQICDKLYANFILNFANVSKVFDNKLLLDKINFTITKGTLTTLIGPNGAGKTTIARLILGLEQPTMGSVNIFSGTKIDYIPQKLHIDKNLPLTAEEFYNLLSAKQIIADKILAAKIIDFADLNNLKHKQITKLSNGQFQKLLISAILSKTANFLVMDEPIQSLDIASQQHFYHLLAEIKKQTNLTIFMISHDLYTVMKNSDQVICLNGHVCCSGKPNDLDSNRDFLNSLSEIGFYQHHHDHKH